MHLVVILACDPPYRPLVPTLRIDLFHSCRTTVFPVPFALGSFDIEASFVTPTGGFGIRLELLSEVVFRGFREEEHLLEIHREAVFHGGRNDRGLVPDDFVAQYPAPQDHRFGEQPRNITQRLVGDTVRRQVYAQFFEAVGVLSAWIVVRSVVLVELAVRIAEIDP